MFLFLFFFAAYNANIGCSQAPNSDDFDDDDVCQLLQVAPENFPEARLAMLAVALTYELLDIEFVKEELNKTSEGDNNEYYRRYNLISFFDLMRSYRQCKNMPRISDLNFFKITRDQVMINMTCNREFILAMKKKLLVSTPPECDVINLAIAEAKVLYLFWDKLDDATAGYYRLDVRRCHLQKLKDLMFKWNGNDASYYAGELYPVVPYWRFREVD